MAFLTVNNVKISGIAACVPENKEDNANYDWITEKERELLIKTTGIRTRRVVKNGICTSDMCYEAAKQLIEQTGTAKTDIEILIFVSQSPDYILPATGIILQDRLGLSKQTMAFDMQLGCSGYVYGLSVLSNLMSTGKFKKGLLLAGDVSSFSQSRSDKSTYPIFGDAGTATLLEYSSSATEMHFNLQSDGAGYRSIMISDGGLRNPYTAESERMVELEPGIIKNKRNLTLDGIEVFNFSLREAPENAKALMTYLNKSNADYDYFIFHQANKIMNESIRKKLKVEADKVPYSLEEFGNTSSASIPLTIVTRLKEEITEKNVSLFLSAFGVGLSWGSASVQISNITCLPLIELK
ncbi:MAG: ketoacyl-ACP synthase [Bacteroidota bacterium]|jgi:3-oxoacyl-[acyl-carrier-protein] synthase-3|nr:ketoacyl-ACP synthase [Bacteroidota bacterium]